MRFRISNLHDAAARDLRCIGKYKTYERKKNTNDAVMRVLFKATQDCKIKGFYLVSDEQFKTYHRSTKQDGAIQMSCGFYKDGDLIPTYDIQMETFEDLVREGYPSGTWEVIK